MEIIREGLRTAPPGLAEVALQVDRRTLEKCRWRGTADDGVEFGFALDQPLQHGAVFFATADRCYRIEQQLERVLELPLPDARQAAQLAWAIGNLHFAIQVDADHLRVIDDAAVRQLFEREQIAFTEANRVFRPVRAAHPHEH